MLRRGAPLQGIGLQSHFPARVTPIDEVWRRLEAFAAFGLPLHITELDINTEDETLRADYTRDFLKLCFSHPAVEAFLMWGFWESAHWIPRAAMFRADWKALCLERLQSLRENALVADAQPFLERPEEAELLRVANLRTVL